MATWEAMLSAQQRMLLITSAWTDTAGSFSDVWHLLRRNVCQSMERYTKLELLQGETQHRVEGFGMQVGLASAWCTVSSCSLLAIELGVRSAACILPVARQHHMHAHGHPQHAAQPAFCTPSTKQRPAPQAQDCQTLTCSPVSSNESLLYVLKAHLQACPRALVY